MCQDAVRTLQFEQISVIGVSAEESIDGPRLDKVEVGGPAFKGDLRVGDVLTEFGKIATPTVCQLALAVARSMAGGETEAKFLRSGMRMQVSIIPAAKINSR
jgi:S1-C subfamily serine protease